jgi:parallel beta-helix repeat protein
MSASQDPINLFPLERAYQRNSIVFNQREYSVMDVPDVHPGADFDSAPGIQRLIDLVTDDGGGVVFFPTGIYRIDTGLTIGSNVILKAHDPLTSVIELGATGLVAVTNKASAENWSVQGIGFQVGVGISNAGTTAVLANATSNISIRECIAGPGVLLRPGVAINRFDVGFDVVDSSAASILDSKATSDTASFRVRTSVGSGSGTVISRCSTYSEAELAGSSSGAADYVITGSGGGTLTGTSLFQCKSEDAGSTSFVQLGSGVSQGTWIACTSTNSGTIGFSLEGTNTDSVANFRDCVATGSGTNGYNLASGTTFVTWVACSSDQAGNIAFNINGSNTLLENCEATGAQGAGLGIGSFVVSGANDSEMVGCKASGGAAAGFSVGGLGSNVARVHFVDCVSKSNAQQGFNLFAVFGTLTNMQIASCYAEGNESTGFSVGATPGSDSAPKETVLVGCTAHDNGAGGFQLGDDLDEAIVVGCMATDNTGDGFNITNAERVRVSACGSYTSTGIGFDVTGSADFSIADCIAENSGGDGFNFSNVDRAQVKDCAAVTSGGFGFDVLTTCSDISLDGNRAYNSTSDGFRLTAVTNAELSNNVAVLNTLDGFFINGGSAIQMVGNISKENTVDGFDLESVADAQMSSNQSWNNGATGYHVNVCTDAQISSNVSRNHLAGKGFHIQACTDVHANGNTSRDNSDDGFHIDNCTRSDLSGNRANDNESEGFHIDDSTTVHMTGNYAYNNTADGITVDGTSGDIHLDSNHSHDNTGDGIHVDTITNCQLSGNQTRDNGGDGLHMDTCTDWQLHNHRSESNTGTGILLTSNGGDYHVSHCVSTGHGTPIASGGNMFETGGTTTARIIDNDIELTIPPTLAFTAALTIPNFPDIFRLTGTATTTSMIGSYVGRRVFLLNASGTQTLANTATLDLDAIAGSPYVMNVAKERIEIYYDGVAWIEESRSGP